MDILNLLNSTGKNCFVKYSEEFASNKTNHEVVNLLITEENYTLNASRTRVSKARGIIRRGHSITALAMILYSDLSEIGLDTKNKASTLIEVIARNFNQRKADF